MTTAICPTCGEHDNFDFVPVQSPEALRERLHRAGPFAGVMLGPDWTVEQAAALKDQQFHTQYIMLEITFGVICDCAECGEKRKALRAEGDRRLEVGWLKREAPAGAAT